MELSFIKYEATDFDTFYEMVCQDEIMKYISGKGLTEEQASEKFGSILQQNKEHDALGYFKVLTDQGLFIGDCKLVCYKHDTSLLEIGYILKKEYWGQGYGKSICHEMLRLAAEKFPDKNIIGLIDPENIASRKLLEKFGFKTYFSGIEDELPTEKLMLKKN